MRRPMVAGNWKMHGTRASVAELTKGLSNLALPSGVEVAVFPPALFINQVIDGLAGKEITVGAQNSAVQPEQGALTGEVAPEQLVEAGCKLVLIGHSERRQYHGETDDAVAAKTAAALANGITPIVCVGETLAQREAGQTEAVIVSQIDAILARLPAGGLGKIVVAYEPVWAIGTGRTATPDMAQEVHAMLRQRMRAVDEGAAQTVRILYGGSMKPDNAAELLAMPDIDGGLVGGAALKAADFFGIVCKS